MNQKTKLFLKLKFQEYYNSASIHLPPELASREWGFISFDQMPETIMRRHKSFGSIREMRDYLSAMAPAHAYHSVAYYEYPNAPNMKEKHWQGADLIFDLDADHLPGAPTSYADMLEHVKVEALKLLDFLTNDFGIAENDITTVFSGGRGYHFHISNSSVRTLESAERREIVDYVSGRGLDLKHILGKKHVGGDAGRESADVPGFPSEEEGGWPGRINRYIVSYLSDVAEQENAIRILTGFDGIGKITAERLIEVFNDPEKIEVLKKGNVSVLPTIRSNIFDVLASQAVDRTSAHVDEPVTADIKRLIRLPGSLHGGSGMRVTLLDNSELEDFDPLDDAVVFSEKAVQLKVIRPFEVQMMGKELHVEEGVQQLPEYVAVYLMCRGAAEYGSY
ncbi:MAG: DNA primase catalytic subunit PriS [Euryarchaeota archaeon]|nr:DNA primase catalytic subunit PriS [Euryarchaeota archaeon]